MRKYATRCGGRAGGQCSRWSRRAGPRTTIAPPPPARRSATLIARLAFLLEGAHAFRGIGAVAHRGEFGAEPRRQLGRTFFYDVIVHETFHRCQRQRRQIDYLKAERDGLVDRRTVR